MIGRVARPLLALPLGYGPTETLRGAMGLHADAAVGARERVSATSGAVDSDRRSPAATPGEKSVASSRGEVPGGPSDSSALTPSRGEQLFAKNCALCHGETGDGGDSRSALGLAAPAFFPIIPPALF